MVHLGLCQTSCLKRLGTNLVGFSSSCTNLKFPYGIGLQTFIFVFGGEPSLSSYRTLSSRKLRSITMMDVL